MSKIKKELNEETKEEVIDKEECCCSEEHECCCDGECTCNDCNCDESNMESEEVLILKNTIQNLEERVRYHQAELINYRKRKDEETSNMLKFANQDLIMEILPLVDNFERAIKLSENDPNNSKFIEGFKMLYGNLINTLHKFGVEEIKSTGEKFDPMYHNAVLLDNDSTKEDDIIVDTFITGYMLKDRVIRPSSVKVNKIN